jgi:hypothetical protein
MHTAYIFNEDFEPLENSPFVPGTSVVYFLGKPRWLLGFNADVVRRNHDQTIDVVSHKPANAYPVGSAAYNIL